MRKNFSASSAAPSKSDRIFSWGLCAITAVVFFAAGGAKLAGVPSTVLIFDKIGIGQWFRIATGLIEVVGAIALLVPATAGVGGLLLATTMLFATLTHLFVIDGSPVPAIVLFLMLAAISWLHRRNLAAMLGRLNRA